MKDKILLPNRDGLKNYLVKISGNEYGFVPEFDWVTYNVSYDKDTVRTFDPEGGPLMYVGYHIDGYIITNITNKYGYRFSLKEI